LVITNLWVLIFSFNPNRITHAQFCQVNVAVMQTKFIPRYAIATAHAPFCQTCLCRKES